MLCEPELDAPFELNAPRVPSVTRLTLQIQQQIARAVIN
jgi:hypothetical protein